MASYRCLYIGLTLSSNSADILEEFGGHLFFMIKFIYSEKATKFCKISALLLSYELPVKIKMEISLKFVAFSEYMNFKSKYNPNVSTFLIR